MLTHKIIEFFLLPPLNCFMAGVVGFLLLKRKPRLGRWLLSASFAVLWLLSMHGVSGALIGLLERDAHTPVEQMRGAQAIVVLGSGIYYGAPDFGGDTVSTTSLERVRLAAHLHRRTDLPLLVTGGLGLAGGENSVARLMKRTLENEFAVPVRWSEEQARNTLQNATFSMQLLAPAGVRTIVLVTHAAHMPRSKRIFERAGFQVLPAGTGFRGRTQLTWRSFLPSLAGLYASSTFMHEALGMLWYDAQSVPQPAAATTPTAPKP